MSKTFDLASLDTVAAAETGAELELRHPATGEPLGMFLVLVGSDSSHWRRAISANIDRNPRRQRSPEQALNENINIYAQCTLSWRGIVLDGEELPFTLDNARTLYGRFPWIREQVDAFIGDRANFLPN